MDPKSFINKATDAVLNLQNCINDSTTKLNKEQINKLTPKTITILGLISEMAAKMADISGENRILKEITGNNKQYQNLGKKIIISPKEEQTTEKTEEDIKKQIDPIETGVIGIKNAKDGKIIVTCRNSQHIEKLQEDIKKKFCEKYSTKIPDKRFPSIKVIGVTHQMDKKEIVQNIKIQNEFPEEPQKMEVTVIKNKKLKTGEEYIIYLEVDTQTHGILLQMQKINIGWERVRVFDAFDIKRCYKCYGFNHKGSECKKDSFVCPKCTGDHKSEECMAIRGTEKCNNCINTKNKLKINLDSNHPAWSFECPVYKRKLELEKKKVNFL